MHTTQTPAADVTSHTLDECFQIVDEIEQSYFERIAEAGSSAFMLYGNADDANAVAYAVVAHFSENAYWIAAKARIDAEAPAPSPVVVTVDTSDDLPF